ncbi:CPBP family intramembrane glutamic endopeptidase [Microbulbifer sp. THAF38]|uniref:CPBP family intramembrane glutamic endopeptidase n=1 Tax=Microbulbifer sp. THAF38 TaxID=2587856 RepID=UPI001268EEC1|nr:CPBP family intramembrane glutamic endopeptidase [Microbulbifer sp. THAF38]QFT54488.1 CAAX amino terminal protease self- immunity [Microbulbifer sp. THAF38]
MSQGKGHRIDIFSTMMWVQGGCLLLAAIGFGFSEVALPAFESAILSSVAWGILGALLSFVAVVVLTRSHNRVGRALRWHCGRLAPIFSKMPLVQLVILSIAAGVCEELLFRGFLQTWLSQLSSPLLGLFVASLIFALLHWASLIYVLLIFVFGLILGYAYQVSGSLLGVIVWHAVYDFFALAALAYYPKVLGADRWLSE